MENKFYRTISANKETANKEWVIVNAENEVLGRLAAKIAMLLRGKHKVNFTPHADCGEYVIIVNAEKVLLTGNKLTKKEYVRYTGYPGGQRHATPQEMLAKKPEFILEHAIKGMLPKNKLGKEIFRHLYVYAGNEHPHQAQNPKAINLNSIK